jgi:hypothetical protein
VQGVHWGAGNYEPGVGPGELTITEFFQGVTDSPYMDWLSEYNTTNQPRLQDVPAQTIGRGSYQGETTIAPSTSSTTISDSTIANELVHQIDSGVVPPPQLDASGQVQTLYAMYFPDTITIADGGMVGGEPGGFCAYHSALVLHDSLVVPYMVLPDFETHHFAQGCGDDAALFNNFTSVVSHELVESITDPAPGFGWLDASDTTTGGEIADICQFTADPSGPSASVTGGNGLPFVVQKEFSNTANDCVATRSVPTPPRDGFVDACGLAGRTGFPDAGLAGDCLKQYGLSLGKNDGSFGENDGLIRSQVSSLLARLIDASGATLTATGAFADVTPLANVQVRNEIEQLAGAGIIAGFPDGLFHPNDNLSVAQAATLVMRTLAFIHASNPSAPDVADQGSTPANYLVAVNNGLLDRDASNIRGFSYATGMSDTTDRGLLADVLAQGVQRLVDSGVITRA